MLKCSNVYFQYWNGEKEEKFRQNYLIFFYKHFQRNCKFLHWNCGETDISVKQTFPLTGEKCLKFLHEQEKFKYFFFGDGAGRFKEAVRSCSYNVKEKHKRRRNSWSDYHLPVIQSFSSYSSEKHNYSKTKKQIEKKIFILPDTTPLFF